MRIEIHLIRLVQAVLLQMLWSIVMTWRSYGSVVVDIITVLDATVVWHYIQTSRHGYTKQQVYLIDNVTNSKLVVLLILDH